MQVDGDVVAAMRAMGVDPERIAAAEEDAEAASAGGEEDATEVIEIWEENEPHVRFFLAVRTQWVHVGFEAVRVGLNYPATEVVARAQGIRGKAWGECFRALQVMEAEVLAVDAEQRARKAD